MDDRGRAEGCGPANEMLPFPLQPFEDSGLSNDSNQRRFSSNNTAHSPNQALPGSSDSSAVNNTSSAVNNTSSVPLLSSDERRGLSLNSEDFQTAPDEYVFRDAAMPSHIHHGHEIVSAPEQDNSLERFHSESTASSVEVTRRERLRERLNEAKKRAAEADREADDLDRFKDLCCAEEEIHLKHTINKIKDHAGKWARDAEEAVNLSADGLIEQAKCKTQRAKDAREKRVADLRQYAATTRQLVCKFESAQTPEETNAALPRLCAKLEDSSLDPISSSHAGVTSIRFVGDPFSSRVPRSEVVNDCSMLGTIDDVPKFGFRHCQLPKFRDSDRELRVPSECCRIPGTSLLLESFFIEGMYIIDGHYNRTRVGKQNVVHRGLSAIDYDGKVRVYCTENDREIGNTKNTLLIYELCQPFPKKYELRLLKDPIPLPGAEKILGVDACVLSKQVAIADWFGTVFIFDLEGNPLGESQDGGDDSASVGSPHSQVGCSEVGGRPMYVTHQPGTPLVFYSDRGGVDAVILTGIFCLDTSASFSKKWHIFLDTPRNIQYSDGRVFVTHQGNKGKGNIVDVLSAVDGHELDTIFCPGVARGLVREENGDVTIISYTDYLNREDDE